MDDIDELGYDSPPLLEDDGREYEYSSEESDDDHELTHMSLGERWQHVMKRLRDGKVRWDSIEDNADDGEVEDGERSTGQDSKADVLDTRMKKSLAEVDPEDKNSPTLLHRLAGSFAGDGFEELATETQIKIVGYLLQERKDFPHRNPDEDPILTKAIRKDNLDFINLVLRHCKRHLPDLLDAQHDRHGNCLHYLFKTHLPQAVDLHLKRESLRKKGVLQLPREKNLPLRVIIPFLGEFVKHAKASSVTTPDEFGNTPIHYAMEYKICRVGIVQYPKHVLALIKIGDQIESRVGQFNKDAESPYLYFERTKKKFLANLTKPKQAQTRGKSDIYGTTRGLKQLESKTEKPEAPSLKAAIRPREVGRDQDTSWRESEDKNVRHRENPKDLGLEKSEPPAEDPKVPPSKGERRKGDNITSVKDPGLVNSHTEYGFRRSRTAELAKTATDLKSTGVSARVSSDFTAHVDTGASTTGASAQASTSAKRQPDKSRASADKHAAQKLAAGEDLKPQAAAEKIRRMLKLHYIRSQPDTVAKELLYGKVASDKNLYFNATHLQGKSADEVTKLIDMLKKLGGFEDALSSVSLPMLSSTYDNIAGSGPKAKPYDSNEHRRRDTGGQEDKSKGRSSAVAIFDKLAEVGVRNIVRLQVEEPQDTNSAPHTDSAIERALRGQDSMSPGSMKQERSISVEEWDWRKFDMSTDVIRFCSPGLREVNLYWSGNQTVLMGWASDEGIPLMYQESYDKLEKVYRLETIIINWTPGIEGYQRCKGLLLKFVDHIKSRTCEKAQAQAAEEQKAQAQRTAITYTGLKVRTTQLSAPSNADNSDGDMYPGSSTYNSLGAPPEHKWIESMKNFRRALMKMHEGLPQDMKPKRIKVAVIDDGIDLDRTLSTNLSTYGDRVEVTGFSYCNSSSSTTLSNPSWHQSTYGHGTIMANSVARINPWVSLYTMRIQDEVDTGQPNYTSIRIHADSAARAIEDAIIREVDIISISWTIRNLSKQGAHAAHGYGAEASAAVDALKQAIDSAKAKGIIMFCSASDDIQTKGIDTLPYSQAREHAFRIGAADAWGESDKATEDQKTIAWFFPGKQVADDFNPRRVRSSELKYRDGSSVSTALAAGLASLILYLPNVMEVYYRRDARAERLARYNDGAQKREVVEKAFDNIAKRDDFYKEKKFLPVWAVFGWAADSLTDSLSSNKDSEANWEILDRLCTTLFVV